MLLSLVKNVDWRQFRTLRRDHRRPTAATKRGRIAPMSLEEEAIALLLRSPRLEVGTIIDLLDVSDREFREMVKHNAQIAMLMAERRDGTLAPPEAEPAQCPACDEWFLPYASARFCSDSCRTVGRLTRQTRRSSRV
jgi:hypothetical protein